jgi:hypothetical protein
MMSQCPALKRCGDALAAFADTMKIFLWNLKIPIDVIPTMRYILLILSSEGPLLEAILQRTERELAGTGGPERPTGWWPRWSAGRCRALRHWARAVTLPREVGTLILPLRVPAGALAPPAAPSPRAVAEGLANLGRIAPRE